MRLDRNLVAAHAQIGNGKILLGRAEETDSHIQEALRLSPEDRFVNVWCTIAGIAKLHPGLESEAVAWLNRSIETSRNDPMPSHFCLFGRSVDLDQPAEAGPRLAPDWQ